MTRRKPAWMRTLCPDTCNTAHLEARKCEACREWVAVCTAGPVEEKYDPGIVEYGRGLTTALLLRRHITRIVMLPGGRLFHLADPCGPRGIRPDGIYLCEHRCFTTPISMTPFKPPKPPRAKPADFGTPPSAEELDAFRRIWRKP